MKFPSLTSILVFSALLIGSYGALSTALADDDTATGEYIHLAQLDRCAGVRRPNVSCIDQGDMLIITDANDPSRNRVVFTEPQPRERRTGNETQNDGWATWEDQNDGWATWEGYPPAYEEGYERYEEYTPAYEDGYSEGYEFSTGSEFGTSRTEFGKSDGSDCFGNACLSNNSDSGDHCQFGNLCDKSSNTFLNPTCVGNACPRAPRTFDPLNPPPNSIPVSGGSCKGFFLHGFRCAEGNGKAFMVPESWFNLNR